MFENKKANIVLALLIAISLWAYVTGSVNPEITSKFMNIPIKFINEDSLTSNGLAIDSIENAYIDVTVSGTRTDVKDLENNDIKVVADMYNRYMGDNYVPLEVTLPKGIELESKSIDKIHVVIGELTSRNFKIEVDTEGTLDSEMALGATKIDPEETTVVGTEKNLDLIDKVVARFDATQASEKVESYQCDVAMEDRNGGVVNFVTPARDTVTVTTKLEQVKKVPLKVNVIGEPAEGYQVGKIKEPGTVKIVGNSDVIEKIDEIQAEDIDISGLSETKEFLLEFKLPEGVRINNEKSLVVTVNIEAPVDKTFVYNSNMIEINNLDDDLDGEILDSVKVFISGKDSVVEGLVRENVVISVDASGLREGTHSVDVLAVLRSDNHEDKVTITCEPATVNLVITEK